MGEVIPSHVFIIRRRISEVVKVDPSLKHVTHEVEFRPLPKLVTTMDRAGKVIGYRPAAIESVKTEVLDALQHSG